MTPRIKERIINGSISFLTAITAVVLGFMLTSSEKREITFKNELDEKAPYEYVDKQDNQLQQNLNIYKQEHQLQHSQEYQAIQDQLDLLIRLVKED